MPDAIAAAPSQDRLAELRASAKGWHGVQMAVLGFIGLCGVLQRGDAADPSWLEVWALVLVLVSFFLACLAILLVGRAAWPLYGPQPELPSEEEYARSLASTSRQLSRGLALTFVSVAVLALATATSWWPSEDAGGASVEVQATSGQTVCGELGEAPSGELRVISDGQPVRVPFDAVTALRVVDGC
ncbi:MAG: hypothetical protein ACRDLS_11010 [Solirubrobacteraceae bacterium]